MQINFQGKYDKSTFYQAVALANRPPKNRQRWMMLLLALALGTLGALIYRSVASGEFANYAIYLGGVILIIGVIGEILLRPYFTARKLWRSPGTRRHLKGRVTAQGITYTLPEGENSIPWERFARMQKTNDLLTLVRDDGLLLVFPQSFFKNQQNWGKFNQLVESRTSIAKQQDRQKK
ncbi:MAG TPA: YcxB family protein [Anaerolineales bacterium]|nr:YcxB family protein [Anaerolineales bacterium]